MLKASWGIQAIKKSKVNRQVYLSGRLAELDGHRDIDTGG